MRKYRVRTSVFFIQTPLNFDIDSKEQHKLIWRRRRRNYVVYKEMHSTSIKSKHRILICPFYIQIMGLHFKSFDVGKSPFCGKVYLWKLFITVGWNQTCPVMHANAISLFLLKYCNISLLFFINDLLQYCIIIFWKMHYLVCIIFSHNFF